MVKLEGQLQTPFSLAGRRVWVAGHNGMVGHALVRRLAREQCELLTSSRDQLDLRRQKDTESWLEANRPDVIVLAAAEVGGIIANDTQPAEFIYDNLAIELNVIEAARRIGVTKFLFLGLWAFIRDLLRSRLLKVSSCVGRWNLTNQWDQWRRFRE